MKPSPGLLSVFAFCILVVSISVAASEQPASFSSHQRLDVGATGWSGVYSWNFGTDTGFWSGDSNGDYVQPFSTPYPSWMGLYIYDTGAGYWTDATYSLREIWESPIQMVSVPAGTFLMGNSGRGDDATAPYTDSEFPTHTVTLSSYEIGRHEVTNGEYCEVLNWALGEGYLEVSVFFGIEQVLSVYTSGTILLRGDDSSIDYTSGSFSVSAGHGSGGTCPMEHHPATGMSWYGAAAFCNWRSEMDGLTPCYDLTSWTLTVPYPDGYRLPTEAEWERSAAWDGSKHWIYSFTSDILAGYDRCNYGPAFPFLGLAGSSPVA